MTSRNQRKSKKSETKLHHDEISCSAIFRHPDSALGFHQPHTLSTKSDWLKPTNLLCWHCCHSFTGSPAYAPQNMRDDGTYEVFGNFCSVACSKSYILESKTFDTNRQLMILNKMAVEIYHSDLPIPHAPPRICLKAFGGDMNIEEFRGVSVNQIIKARSPPFAAASVMIQTLSKTPGKRAVAKSETPNYPSWNVRDIRREGRDDNEPSASGGLDQFLH